MFFAKEEALALDVAPHGICSLSITKGSEARVEKIVWIIAFYCASTVIKRPMV